METKTIALCLIIYLIVLFGVMLLTIKAAGL